MLQEHNKGLNSFVYTFPLIVQYFMDNGNGIILLLQRVFVQ